MPGTLATTIHLGAKGFLNGGFPKTPENERRTKLLQREIQPSRPTQLNRRTSETLSA
jgi:hypothetical protein